jgi:hypothetical protein
MFGAPRRQGVVREYRPDGAVLRAFFKSDALFRVIRGPVGSGKSAACCIELFRLAVSYPPSDDGIRRSRWLVTRNTGPQLRTTTIETFLQWFPDNSPFGRMRWSPPLTYEFRFKDVEADVLFMPLDRPDQVRDLRSLDLSGAWANEIKEQSKEIIDVIDERLGRYRPPGAPIPPRKWFIADSNAWDADCWLAWVFGEAPVPMWLAEEIRSEFPVRPPGWELFLQPPALIEKFGPDGRTVVGYELNPLAENIRNLRPNYYLDLIVGKSKAYIDQYLMNRLVSTADGMRVYPEYVDDIHLVRERLVPVPNVKLVLGFDFGLTPACVVLQVVNGQRRVLREFVSWNMGLQQFVRDVVLPGLHEAFPQHMAEGRYVAWGDPAGSQRAQTDARTPFAIAAAEGLTIYPAETNDPEVRQGAVRSLLMQRVNEGPALVVSEDCPILRSGFLGGYRMRRLRVSGEARYEMEPVKDQFSHVHDALQYAVLGTGAGRQLLRGRRPVVRVKAPSSYSPLGQFASRR